MSEKRDRQRAAREAKADEIPVRPPVSERIEQFASRPGPSAIGKRIGIALVLSGIAPGVLGGWAYTGLDASGAGPPLRVTALAWLFVLFAYVRWKAGTWDIWAVRICGAATLMYLLAFGVTVQVAA